MTVLDRMTVFDSSSMLGGVLVLKGKDRPGEEELHDSYSSQNIVIMTTLQRIIRARRVARMRAVGETLA
jgi:hypothetical protein